MRALPHEPGGPNAEPEGKVAHAQHPRVTALALAVASLVTLGGSLAAVSASSTAASPAAVAAFQQAFANVPEYAGAPALDRGQIVEHGAPVAGATVLLLPIPEAGKPGTQVAALSRAVTDTSGRFIVHLPASLDGGLLMDAGARNVPGVLNVHLMVIYPGGVGDWFEPVHAGQEAVTAPITLHAEAFTAAKPPGHLPPGPCTFESHRTYGPIPVLVGYKSSLNEWLGWANYSYSSSSTMNLGAAVSYDGWLGGFSADGTTAETAGGSYTWPKEPGYGALSYDGSGYYWDTFYVCGSPKTGFYDEWVATQRTVGGDGGGGGAHPVNANFCYGAGVGGTARITSSNQETWSGGVHLADAGFNINVTSQDGWQTQTALTYQYGSIPSPYCGEHAFPNEQGSDAVQVTAP